jgi:hypothetical protein
MFLKNQKTDKVLQDWASQIEASLNEVRCFPTAPDTRLSAILHP